MIIKENRIKCDNCGLSETFLGNKEDTMTQARKYGWIVKYVTWNDKHYCNKSCYDNWKARLRDENKEYEDEVIPRKLGKIEVESVKD